MDKEEEDKEEEDKEDKEEDKEPNGCYMRRPTCSSHSMSGLCSIEELQEGGDGDVVLGEGPQLLENDPNSLGLQGLGDTEGGGQGGGGRGQGGGGDGGGEGAEVAAGNYKKGRLETSHVVEVMGDLSRTRAPSPSRPGPSGPPAGPGLPGGRGVGEEREGRKGCGEEREDSVERRGGMKGRG